MQLIYLGFMGKLCELEARKCLAQPCSNGGVCKDTNDDYE